MQDNVGVPHPVALAGAVRAGTPHDPVVNRQRSQEVYHVLPRRAGALLIDAVLWAIPTVVLAISVGTTTEPVMVETATGWEMSEQLTLHLSLPQIWGVTCLWFAYLILSEHRLGATLGKRAFGLAVVQSDGETSGLRAVVLRQLPRFVIISLLMLMSLHVVVPLVFLIEAIVARSHDFRQRIGDRLADTVVAPVAYARTLARQPSTGTVWRPGNTSWVPGSGQAPAAESRVYARFWPRFFALVVDFLVLAVLTELLAAIGLMPSAFSLSGEISDDPLGTMPAATELLEGVLSLSLTAAYFIYFNGRGATLGKRLLGLRVVDPTGHAPGMRRAALRYIIPGIGHFVWLSVSFAIAVSFATGGFDGVVLAAGIALVVGFAYTLFELYDGLSMLWHDHRQTLHDRMGGTFVVRKDGDNA